MVRRVQSFLRWLWDVAEDADFWAALRSTPAIWVITGVVIVVSGADFMFRHSSGVGVLTHYLGIGSADVARGQVWRVLTETLVNPAIWVGSRYTSGLEHLVLNVLGLVLVGPRVERSVGTKRFVALFVVATLAGNTANALGLGLHWSYGGGTSGALFGVLGALVVITFLERDRSSSKRRFFMAAWIGVGLSALTSIGNGAGNNVSHLGGFLAGVALALAWKTTWWRSARAGVAVPAALVLVAVAAFATRGALLRRVDPAIVDTIPTGRSPVVLRLAFGSLWANGEGNGPIVRINPGTNRVVATIPAEAAGGMVAVGGSLWVSGHGQVVEVDPAKNRVRSRIRVPGEGPWGLAASGNVLWAALPDRGAVARIDVPTRRVEEFRVGRRPYAVLAAGNAVWVTSYASQSITRLNPKTGIVEQVADFNGFPYWMEFVRGSLWVGDERGVSRLDPKTLELIEHVDVGQGIWQMAVDAQGQLWVAERVGFEVSQIDTRANKVVRRLRVGMRQPAGVAAAEDLWIADTVKREVLYANLVEGG